MQRVPAAESENDQDTPQQQVRLLTCKRAALGAGAVVVLALCGVALQKGPQLLAGHLQSPPVVEGQPELQQAWRDGSRWRGGNRGGQSRSNWHRGGKRWHGKRPWSVKTFTEDRHEREAEKTWKVLSGKAPTFTNKPRVRREWRTLSATMRSKVAAAFWKVKTLTTAEGQRRYGKHFHNHDDMLMLHACATTDPRCDEGHFGPQFMTFHRALLLKYEKSLLSVDPSIEAMPYWNMAFDSVDGKYKNTVNYIFTNNFFGSYTGTGVNYQVIDGLFANWPVAHFSSERFGNKSSMVRNKCIREEYFQGTTADVCDKCYELPSGCVCEDGDTYSTYLRAHKDCSPHVARYPQDPAGLGPLGGTWEIVYTEEDFDKCTDIANVRSWMEWQDCIEMSTFMCSQRFERMSSRPKFLKVFREVILPQMQRRAAALGQDAEGRSVRQAVRDLQDAADAAATTSDSFTEVLQKLVKEICGDYMLYGFIKSRVHLGRPNNNSYPHFFHSQAHIKFGRDLLDVTTSPNEAAAFTGYHSDIDRSNMVWMLRSQAANPAMNPADWLYPKKQVVTPEEMHKGKSEGLGKGISGPFAIYDVMACGNDTEKFYEYRVGESPWLPGTLLKDVVNSGFPFYDLFTCGPTECCSGGKKGYTHEDILY